MPPAGFEPAIPEGERPQTARPLSSTTGKGKGKVHPRTGHEGPKRE